MGQDILGIVILMAFIMLQPEVHGPLPSASVVEIWKADRVLMHRVPIATAENNSEVRVLEPIGTRVTRIGSAIACIRIKPWLMIFLHVHDPFVRSQELILSAAWNI
jgi:hypothetical protein